LSAFLKVEITENGMNDYYQFSYKLNEANSWIILNSNPISTYSYDRAALFYKTGEAKSGTSFDYIRFESGSVSTLEDTAKSIQGIQIADSDATTVTETKTETKTDTETKTETSNFELQLDPAQHNSFEVSQLVFHEQYSQQAMESALDYYLENNEVSENTEAITENHAGVSDQVNEIEQTELVENSINIEIDQSQQSITDLSDNIVDEIDSTATSSNLEFVNNDVPDQQIDNNENSNLLIDLALSTPSNYDEILHLEINKN
jgi:hypothetical protein